MIGVIFVKSLTILSVILVLLIQTAIEPFLRWFTPDLFFLILLVHTLITRRLDFVSLFFLCLFYDVFTDNTFGATILATAIVFYFIELIRFAQLRYSLLGSTGVLALFYSAYLVVQQIIGFGIVGLTNPSSLYLFFSMFSTVVVWIIVWRFQRGSKHKS